MIDSFMTNAYKWTEERVNKMNDFVRKVNKGEIEVKKFESVQDFIKTITKTK